MKPNNGLNIFFTRAIRARGFNSMKYLGELTLTLMHIMGRATMDLEEAVEASVEIQPKIAMPMNRSDSD